MVTTAPPAQPRARRVLGSILLDVFALGGLICILLVIAAFVFKITLIMFATGSMSPAIPTGSVALVREIPASEMSVGDVVTVDRGRELPVTHRVIEILSVDGDRATFRMQGDANADPDPVDYTAERVRLVMWSIPGLAGVIVWFQNPFVLGAITLAAAALVTWAFWPRQQASAAPVDEPDEARSD